MLDWQTVRAEMVAWRHHVHAHPEFGFDVGRTAAFVAAKLREVGRHAATARRRLA